MKRYVRGFTLVEMLVAMALMALIMVAAGLAIEAAQTSHTYNAEKNDLIARARGVLDRIAQDIHRSSSFAVIDTRTVTITLNDGAVHTYYWDGSPRGSLRYTETPVGGLESPPAVMTGSVESFEVAEDGMACRIRIALAGNEATCGATMTATPRKILF